MLYWETDACSLFRRDGKDMTRDKSSWEGFLGSRGQSKKEDRIEVIRKEKRESVLRKKYSCSVRRSWKGSIWWF